MNAWSSSKSKPYQWKTQYNFWTAYYGLETRLWQEKENWELPHHTFSRALDLPHLKLLIQHHYCVSGTNTHEKHGNVFMCDFTHGKSHYVLSVFLFLLLMNFWDSNFSWNSQNSGKSVTLLYLRIFKCVYMTYSI